jgi:hypothetical protein
MRWMNRDVGVESDAEEIYGSYGVSVGPFFGISAGLWGDECSDIKLTTSDD